MKTRNTIILLIASFSITLFGLGSCDAGLKHLSDEIFEPHTIEKSISTDAIYIGEMHNIFVSRAYNDHIPNVQNPDDVLLDIINLIDYFASFSESIGLNEIDLLLIKDFFASFETDSTCSISYLDQFNKYIVLSIEERDSLDYDNIVNGVLIGNVTMEMMDVATEVTQKSKEFWSTFSNRSEDGSSAVIAADTGGALWGLFFGPVGSIISGGVASIIANEMESDDSNFTIKDDKIYTPKDFF